MAVITKITRIIHKTPELKNKPLLFRLVGGAIMAKTDIGKISVEIIIEIKILFFIFLWVWDAIVARCVLRVSICVSIKWFHSIFETSTTTPSAHTSPVINKRKAQIINPKRKNYH